MKKFLTILVFLCLAVCKAGAYEWTDANGVTWTFYRSSFTINGEYQDLWYIEGAKDYGENVTVPETVYKDSEAVTIEAITGPRFPNASNVTLPASIKYLGSSPFKSDMYAGTVTVNSTTPPTISTDYSSFGDGVTVLVPSASLNSYRSAEGWKDIAVRIISKSAKTNYSITAYAMTSSSGIHSKIGEESLGNVMSLTVTGSINSYDILIMRNKMYNLHHLDLTNARIVSSTYKYYEDYSTTDDIMGRYAFYNMTKLISVKLPKTITTVSNCAFKNCYGLQTVEFQAGLQTIRDDAFYECRNLKKVQLKSGLESIGSSAFADCYALTSVSLPKTLKTIGSSTFASCSALPTIEIPEGITILNSSTFSSCRSLKSVSLPSSLLTIESGCFNSCYSLTSITLPIKLKYIKGSAFESCSALTEVHIPSTIRSIGSRAFFGCTNLKDYYVYTIEPTNIEESTFSNWTTASLHIPRHAYDNYYWNTQWSKFAKLVQDNSYQYKYFYLTQDYVFNDAVGTMSSTPDVQLDGGSGLVVETTSTVNLNEIHMADNGTSAASIIANGNLKAETLFIELEVKANKWYFISLPFRVKASNVQAPGQYVIRYYDGKERATNGKGGWKNYTEAYLQPKQGYILQCNTDGTITMTVEQGDLDFSGGDRQDALTSYVSENTQNSSWNYLGNPHSSYFDIDDTGYDAPITVWNGSSYQAVRAGDDQYHLGPLQGFFVQKPEGKAQISFPASGRHTLNQWADRVAAKNATSRSRAESQSQRQLVNLTIGDGEKVDDQTRVVFNPVKSQSYEMDCDAAKFMSDQPVAQLYSLDEQTRYAINERPQGEVNLGYVAPEKGLLTINAVRIDSPVLLRDNEMGITHDLTMGGYTFNTEAGTFESRFVLTFDLTAINKVENNSMAEKGTVYTFGGTQLPNGSQRNGAYILKNGNKVTKVLKK